MPNKLRWLGFQQPNSYDMLDDQHFARFGLPRVINDQPVNGGSFDAADFGAYRPDEAVAALPKLNQMIMLNWERCMGWKYGVRWVVATIEALKKRRPDCRVGMFDFRDGGACDEVVDLWWPSATVTEATVPMGAYEKDAALYWLGMRFRTYHAAIARATGSDREVIPVLHVKDMDGDKIRSVLTMLAMLPSELRRIATWAYIERADALGYVHTVAKIKAVEDRWDALNGARGVA